MQYYITVSKQTLSLFEMIYLSDYLTHCANYQCCPSSCTCFSTPMCRV